MNLTTIKSKLESIGYKIHHIEKSIWHHANNEFYVTSVDFPTKYNGQAFNRKLEKIGLKVVYDCCDYKSITRWLLTEI